MIRKTTGLLLVIAFAVFLASCISHQQVGQKDLTPYIYVMGGVRHPGVYAWTNGVTLTNAINLAGGFTEFAMPRRIRFLQFNGSNVWSLARYNYTQIMAGQTNNPVLNPKDKVIVPERFW